MSFFRPWNGRIPSKKMPAKGVRCPKMCQQSMCPSWYHQQEAIEKHDMTSPSIPRQMNKPTRQITLQKFNIAPETLPGPNRKIVFQTIIFQGQTVQLWGGAFQPINLVCSWLWLLWHLQGLGDLSWWVELIGSSMQDALSVLKEATTCHDSRQYPPWNSSHLKMDG